MKTYEKVLLKSITTIIVLVYIIISMNLRVYASNTQNTLIDGTVVEKISNPDAREGETDGLIDGGDRETSYAWAMATRGDYVYIGTNKNIVGGIANTFVQSMVSSGIPEDTAWELVNSMTNNEIPRPETEEGGQIFKCNINTGDIEVIYTAPKDVAFRMGIEFDGDLYFCSFSSDTSADNYIYKIDENDNITIAFTSKTGTSLRAACIYEDSLLFGGVDSRQELDQGDEDCQKLAILQKDANDDTKWERIADYKDFKDYATDPAAFSNVSSPIWDMCVYDGYVWASLPNSAGIVMYKGHPAEGNEPANEYGWYWTEVIGKYNGVNNLGLADDVDGYTGDEAGLVTMAATPFTFKDGLYLMNFDNTITATATAVGGILSSLSSSNAKASDYLKPMYITLNNPQKLWKYDDASGKFVEVTGFSKYMKDNCIEYIWRTETYNNKLYLTTMDSAVLYNYTKNLKGSNFTDLTETEFSEFVNRIDNLISILQGLGVEGEQLKIIEELLENIKSFLQEYVEVANDNDKFFKFVIENESLINQIEALGNGSNSILDMADEELKALYNRVDWTGLKMYSFIAKTVENDVWGFDLLVSSDGENFELVTDNGFGDKYNYGGRSLIATDKGLYIGTANPFYGAQLWRLTDGSEQEDNKNPNDDDQNQNPTPDNPDKNNQNSIKDPTIAPDDLPAAGISYMIVIGAVVIGTLAFLGYKYNKYKNLLKF